MNIATYTHRPLQTIAFALAFAGGIAAATVSHAQSGSAGAVQEQRPVGAFKAIDVSGPYDIVIRAQGAPSLQLNGASKELANIDTQVSGDTLIVRPRRRGGLSFSFGLRPDRVTVTITTPVLHRLAMSGSGDAHLDAVSGDSLRIDATGPGDLRGAGAVRELVVTSSGSGDLDLQRLKASDLTLRMSGPGDVHLAGAAARLDAQIKGSGDLDVERMRAESVRIVMHGPGDVRIGGETGVLTADVNGSGTLDASGLGARKATVRGRGPGAIALATISDTLDADLRGSGSLEAAMAGKRLALTLRGPGDATLRGAVQQLQVNLDGSGVLEARELLADDAQVAVNGPGHATVSIKPKADGLAQGSRARAPHVLYVDRSSRRQQGD